MHSYLGTSLFWSYFARMIRCAFVLLPYKLCRDTSFEYCLFCWQIEPLFLLFVGLIVDGGAAPDYCFAVCSVLVPHLLFSSRLVLFDSVLLGALVCGLLFGMYRSSSPPGCSGATGWRWKRCSADSEQTCSWAVGCDYDLELGYDLWDLDWAFFILTCICCPINFRNAINIRRKIFNKTNDFNMHRLKFRVFI